LLDTVQQHRLFPPPAPEKKKKNGGLIVHKSGQIDLESWWLNVQPETAAGLDKSAFYGKQRLGKGLGTLEVPSL